MVDPQKPIVKLGTKLKKGVVTGIFRGKIEVTGEAGVQSLKFATVEKEVLSNG
tara:strand:- start:143 stop:301 length:159 start_codon:yes stop_codon:yes gene_type:complete